MSAKEDLHPLLYVVGRISKDEVKVRYSMTSLLLSLLVRTIIHRVLRPLSWNTGMGNRIIQEETMTCYTTWTVTSTQGQIGSTQEY